MLPDRNKTCQFVFIDKFRLLEYYFKTMNTIKCPHCGKLVEISEAVRHEVEETVLKEEREKQKIEIEKVKAQATLEKEKEIKEASQKELEHFEKEKKLLEEKLAKEEEKKEEFEKQALVKAEKEAGDKHRLEKLEWEKQKVDMQKALEDAQRKTKQGSQQLQGEVLELELEAKLKQVFPNDEFLPVPKGVEGGDIWQKINFKGKTVGSILWELKRTKAWSNGWITKLKDDAAKISASECIIISQILPDDIKTFDRKDGVWLSGFENAINVCRFIRFYITSLASVKSTASQTDEEWGRVRDYMLSDSFKHRMQAHFDGIKALRDHHESEKRNTILRWKKTESHIEKLDSNTTNFYGELKAIVSELPEIKGVESPLLEDGEEK
jgi:hypothetical protein